MTLIILGRRRTREKVAFCVEISAFDDERRGKIVTVTKRRCRWCDRLFEVREGPGRPREYCKPSCRQRDYESRRRSEELGLNEDELIVTREELELLKDKLFVLRCAIDDINNADNDDLTRVYDGLLEAARQAVG